MGGFLRGAVGFVFAALATAGSASISSASVVTLDVTVNGGNTPVVAAVGDKLTVRVYATVSDNNFSGIDFGLAGYGVSVTSLGDALRPVQGTNLFNQPDGQWKVTWSLPGGWIGTRGNAANPGYENSVLGHGGFVNPGAIDPSIHSFASTRTLLATGEFLAVAGGATAIALAPPAGANVIWYQNGNYIARPADVVLLQGGAPVAVVVPEPASIVAMITLFGGILSLRRNCGRA